MHLLAFDLLLSDLAFFVSLRQRLLRNVVKGLRQALQLSLSCIISTPLAALLNASKSLSAPHPR
jgi:hypothetical protein